MPNPTFGTAGSGVNLKHSAHDIAFATEHIAQLEVLEQFRRTCIGFVNFLLSHKFFLKEIERQLYLVDSAFELGIIGNPLLQIFDFLHLLLCSLRILPKPSAMVRSCSSSTAIFFPSMSKIPPQRKHTLKSLFLIVLV